MRLLIVENAPDIADLLVRAFSMHGYAADIARDGEQGVELAEINDYDLVVLDLNLPRLDGLEVCRRIRASRPRILIVMLTARNRREDIIVGLDEGADDYLVKPFDFEELAARVRALLRRDMRVRESNVPIVMLTRRGELDDRVKGLEAGADYYLVKPFRIEEVKAVIEALLRRSASPPV
jgi:DNA-binding response OmpR family regulator